MSNEPNYWTIENDRLDRICRARYGTERNGNVEMVLTANREAGLAELGPLLPAGIGIYLPDIAPPSPIKPTTRLWT